MFYKDKSFRKKCLETTELVLENKNFNYHTITTPQKHIAAQYFLFELPIMTHATNILKVKSCDFIYHSMPDFLKHLYLKKEFIDPMQRFLILKDD